jgi:hypothetical protein
MSTFAIFIQSIYYPKFPPSWIVNTQLRSKTSDMGRRCGGIMWYFGLLVQVAFSQHQAPDPYEKPENAETSAPLRIAKMLEGQAIVNRWLASLNYHVLGLCVVVSINFFE